MVQTSVFLLLLLLLSNFHGIHSLDKTKKNNLNGTILNTTSGLYQGQEVRLHNVTIRQFFGIPYGEKPVRFQNSILRKYPNDTVIQAVKRTPGCLQSPSGLSYGPFDLYDMYDEDCLTLNLYIPKRKSLTPRAMMVFCHGGSNQVGSGSLFDGSAVAAIGDVIVITINYRLNILGFLTPDSDIMSGNYGLHDQLLALKWISLNAKRFNGDGTRLTYVGHSAGAANAILLAMSKRSDGLIARVIAQSGCPLNQWAIDRQPNIRFDNVMKMHGMKAKKKLRQTNIDRLKNISSNDFHYMYHSGLEISPDYPFPVIDNTIVTDNLEELIRTGPLTKVDVLIGVTADESIYFAEDHMFHHYLPKRYRALPTVTTSSRSSSESTTTPSFDDEQPRGFSYFKKSRYIRNYLQSNYPDHLCFLDAIEARYKPTREQRNNATQIARLYGNLVSDLMFYYDLVRFLHERLRSEASSSASTYVYYYTYQPIFDREYILRRLPNTVGHFAELDLIWGVPFFNRTVPSLSYHLNLSYTPEETELSRQMIRYWTNFAKTGNPNDQHLIHWPSYEKSTKSYINFHAHQTRIEHLFFEECFQFWQITLNRPRLCTPFRWYHTTLLVGILVLVLVLIIISVFYNTKRIRRNIEPTDLTSTGVLTTYYFSPNVVS